MAGLKLLRKTFALDYRSLALYRFLMGVVILSDLLYRLPDFVDLYTDVGLVPRSIFMTEMAMPWSFSFHLANGSALFIGLMFALHFIFGVMLLVGYKTRWAMFFCWVFTVSLHNRNWLVNNGGDDILRAIQFFSIFLPLNKCFSVDSALLKPKEKCEGEHFSTWTLTFYLQVFCIYFVSYVLKNHPTWRSDFTAVFYASRLDIFSTPIGILTRSFPIYQKLTTIFTIYLEWLGPILLVSAAVFGRFWWVTRLVVIMLFWGLHLGIILTMWIGVFPYLCLVMWAVFLPGKVWEYLGSWYRKKDFHKLSLYFDAECGFCQKLVLILREFFLLPDVNVAEAQSSQAIVKLMKEKHSWVVVNERGERFFYFDAMLEVFRHSPVLKYLVPFFALSTVSAILHKTYVWVSHHRPLFGKMTQFLEYRSPRTKIKTLRWLREGAGAFIFATLLVWNVISIKQWNLKAPFFENIARWTHLYQEWNMFAPFPKMDNIWIEIPAILGDGSQIELLSGSRDIYSDKSGVFPGNVKNEHWRKFYLNVSEKIEYSRYFGGYLCRLWNERHIRQVKDQTLRKMEILVYSRANLPDGSRGAVLRKFSWKHWCFDEDFKRESPVESQGK